MTAARKFAAGLAEIASLGVFLGMIWLYRQTGTLLFFDEGRGLLESGALTSLAGTTTLGGLTVSAAASSSTRPVPCRARLVSLGREAWWP